MLCHLNIFLGRLFWSDVVLGMTHIVCFIPFTKSNDAGKDASVDDPTGSLFAEY